MVPSGTKRLRVDHCGNAVVGYLHPPANPRLLKPVGCACVQRGGSLTRVFLGVLCFFSILAGNLQDPFFFLCVLADSVQYVFFYKRMCICN